MDPRDYADMGSKPKKESKAMEYVGKRFCRTIIASIVIFGMIMLALLLIHSNQEEARMIETYERIINSKNYWTVGSKKEEIKLVQGPPRAINCRTYIDGEKKEWQSETWYYFKKYESELRDDNMNVDVIEFWEDGTVMRYRNNTGNLKVR
jgi:hypothetical protein